MQLLPEEQKGGRNSGRMRSKNEVIRTVYGGCTAWIRRAYGTDTAGIRTVYGMDTEGYGADTERYGEDAKNC